MYKSMLQELCHKYSWDLAEYVTIMEGPHHCPRFSTKCNVRGVCFETPHNECKSSREAQNLAAKIAFEHLSALLSMALPHSVTSPSPSSLPAPGFVFSGNKNLSVKPAAGEELKQINSQPALPSVRGYENSAKGTSHLYKNRLQHLAQKNNLSLPVYSWEFDGPPHAPRFKATVTVDGRPYKTVDFFSTLRDAEQAAAKIAFESLSDGAAQQDESLYKSMLQEFSQKNGMHLPSYNTERIGPSHAATFKCTVEVGGQSFCGGGCKSKKLAEMNAAKIAFNDLAQCKDTRVLADDKASESSEIGSRSLHPLNTNSIPITTAVNNGLQTHVEVTSGEKGSSSANGKTNGSSSVNGKTKGSSSVKGKTKGSSSVNGKTKATSMSPNHVESNENGENGGDVTVFNYSAVGGGDTTRSSKIVIYSRESTMHVPRDASVLPCSNDKWLVTMQPESN